MTRIRAFLDQSAGDAPAFIAVSLFVCLILVFA